jgi:chaperonin GroES
MSTRTLSHKVISFLNRVLVQHVKAVEKTKAGILIPEKVQETLPEGTVLAVGRGAFDGNGNHIPVCGAVGDKVLLPNYDGSNIKVDSEELLLFRDSEILAKLE